MAPVADGELKFTNEQLTKLEQFLAIAIKDPGDIKRLVVQSGIPMSYVDLTGTPVNQWFEGVRKCAEHGFMRGLVQAVNVELDGGPRIQELRALLAPIVRADTTRILVQDIAWLQRALTVLSEVEDPMLAYEPLRQARRSILDLRERIDDDQSWPIVISSKLTESEVTRVRKDVAEGCFSLLSVVDQLLGEVRENEAPIPPRWPGEDIIVASHRRIAALEARRRVLSQLRLFLLLLKRELVLPSEASTLGSQDSSAVIRL